MSASQGCNDDTAVVESFKEALIGRVGADRYQMWFTHGVEIAVDEDDADASSVDRPEAGVAVDRKSGSRIVLSVRGQFALDRLRKNFLREIRGAAMQACGSTTDVRLCLNEPPAAQAELPLDDTQDNGESGKSCGSDDDLESEAGGGRQRSRSRRGHSRRRKRGTARSLSHLIGDGAGKVREEAGCTANGAPRAHQLELPQVSTGGDGSKRPDDEQSAPKRNRPSATARATMNAGNFVAGVCNQLAQTAMIMVSDQPAAASPLFIHGPTGTGKTHLMSAIADQFRRLHRMRRVMHLSAEQFTNDFISSVGNSGITAFRGRYREVDALLIDDVQFLGSKKATLREMLYTVETLAAAGRPLVFSGLHSPTEIQGLSRELAGRLAAGLVCPVQPLDPVTRRKILCRWAQHRCSVAVPDEMIDQINASLAGDGRVISGVVNMINTLQRMNGRNPTMDELHQFGGELLRAAKPVATLSVIETAVCEAFHLPPQTLRSGSQTRAVTGPRMLAMYLSRRLTASAYAEIASHFGGKSHSTAITAENNVKAWLASGKLIGRGPASMSAQDAIQRVESLLRSG